MNVPGANPMYLRAVYCFGSQKQLQRGYTMAQVYGHPAQEFGYLHIMLLESLLLQRKKLVAVREKNCSFQLTTEVQCGHQLWNAFICRIEYTQISSSSNIWYSKHK